MNDARHTLGVMAGLVPAIHVFTTSRRKRDVDARHNAGHDGVCWKSHRSNSAIKLDVSQRLPPMAWISE